MNKKISLLRTIKDILISQNERKFLTAEEKRQLALEGKNVPICIGETKDYFVDYIVPVHQYIPCKRKHKKAGKFRI